MQKTCEKCGRILEEGEVCNCDKVVTQNTVSSANNFGTDILEVILGIFVKPVSIFKKYVQVKNFNLAWIFIGITSLIMGLFVIAVVKEMYSAIFPATYSFFTEVIEIPYFKFFAYGLLFGAINYILLAALIYLIAGVLLKADIDFKKAFVLVAVTSSIMAITLALSALLVFVSGALMFVVLLLGSLYYLLCLYEGLKQTVQLNANRYAHVLTGSLVACFAIIYLIIKALS